MAIKCPDCGNTDEYKMAQAAKGKKVYCLVCHYSFAESSNKVHKTAGPKPREVKDSMEKYSVIINRVDRLERMVKSLEERLANRYPSNTGGKYPRVF